MITHWLITGFVVLAILLMLAAPWLLLWEAWRTPPWQEQPNPIGTLVCVGLCIGEVAAGLDWVLGL